MANKTLTDLFADNPVTTLGDDDLLEVEVSGLSGAIKKVDLAVTLGGGAPQLPAFTYETGGGVPSANDKFTADSDTISSTTTIKFLAYPQILGIRGSIAILTDSTGKFAAFNVTNISGAQLIGTYATGSISGDWSGIYTLTFIPKAQKFEDTLAASGIGSFTGLLAILGITPVADGTVSPVTGITTVSGIVTNIF